MISRTLNIHRPARGLKFASPLERETERGANKGLESYESSTNHSQEEIRNLNFAYSAVKKSTEGRRSSLRSTVTANLVGGATGVAMARELAAMQEKNLLEIDFDRKPSAKSIRENIQSADWVVVKNFDKAGKSHEQEIMEWQLDLGDRLDAERGNPNKVLMSSDETSLTVHGWTVQCKGFKLNGRDVMSYETSGLDYGDWLNQTQAEKNSRGWAYSRELEALRSLPPRKSKNPAWKSFEGSGLSVNEWAKQCQENSITLRDKDYLVAYTLAFEARQSQ